MMKREVRVMNKKVLPVKSPNGFLTYKPFDSTRISVLLAQDKLCKEIYENFMYFSVEKCAYDNGVMKLECHYKEQFSSIGEKRVPIDLILDMDMDFIKFCKKSLDKEFYVFLPIETSEISNYINYKKKPVYHHIFIYGYNDDERVFYCSEFFAFSNDKYSYQTVSYDEMEAAFYKLQRELDEDSLSKEKMQWLKDVHLLHSYTEYRDRFTINRLIVGLQNYLDKRDNNGNKDYIKNLYYGYAIYDLCDIYIEYIVSNNFYYHFDMRPFLLIKDRFHYMKIQSEFVSENYASDSSEINHIVDEFIRLEKEARKMFHLTIKYTMRGENKNVTKILEILDMLKSEDYAVTSRYIECLKHI